MQDGPDLFTIDLSPPCPEDDAGWRVLLLLSNSWLWVGLGVATILALHWHG